MRRLRNIVLVAFAAMPGCILVAGQDGTDCDWAWNHNDLDIMGPSISRVRDLERRVAALEQHMAQCPGCQAAAHEDADDDASPFMYEVH